MKLALFILLSTNAFSQTCQTDKTFVALKPILQDLKLPQNADQFKHKDAEDLSDEKFAVFKIQMKKALDAWQLAITKVDQKLIELGKLNKDFEHRIESINSINAAQDSAEKNFESMTIAANKKFHAFQTKYQDQLSDRYSCMDASIHLDEMKKSMKTFATMITDNERRSEQFDDQFFDLKKSFFIKPPQN